MSPDRANEIVTRRVERSVQALVRRFPDLDPVLRPSPNASIIPVLAEDGVIVDMVLADGQRFYGGDGRTIAARQIEDYFRQPQRLQPDFLAGHPTAGRVERRALAVLTEAIRHQGLDQEGLRTEPDSAHGFLIVLGIGLGHHLPKLIKRTQASYLILIEPNPEFLRQSLSAIDWATLLTEIENEGGAVRLFLASTASPLVTAVRQTLGSVGIPYADGAYVYRHYDTPVLNETAARLREAAEMAYLGRGYYEDERIMLSNAMANLARRSFRLLDGRPRGTRREPAFIIANGPSLDQSIETLKRLRAGAVVFSCGTALRVCRRHGIEPDFHCESENITVVPELLAEVAASFGLGDTVLIASATADGRLSELFAETWFYFREASISTRLLATPEQELRRAAPTASNLALAAAAALGFRVAWLFGVDCGSRFAGRIHAEGSPYDVDATLREEDRVRPLDASVPGNFGGVVATDRVLNWTRVRLSALIAESRLRVWNCSDGAMIEGALPQDASTLRLPRSTIDRALIRAQVRATLPAYRPGEFLQGRSLASARTDAERFYADVITAFRAALEDGPECFALWRRLAPFTEEAPVGYGEISMIAFGPVRHLIKAGLYVARRVPDEHIRSALLRRYVEECQNILSDLRTDTVSMLDLLNQRFLLTLMDQRE